MRPVVGVQIDAFLGFQLRIKSLEFARDEIMRQQARGEEIMAEIARLLPSGDPLRDAQVRAGWDELLDEAFDAYGTALDKLGWEMDRNEML